MQQKYKVHDCPVVEYFKLLGSCWTFCLLLELNAKNAHFLELKNALNPITSRALSLSLQKALNGKLLIKYEDRYAITELGRKLLAKTLEGSSDIIKNHPMCINCRGKELCVPYDSVLIGVQQA